MSYVAATILALALGLAVPEVCAVLCRRIGAALRREQAQIAYVQAVRRRGIHLPPAWRIARRRLDEPLPPTRHIRLVRIADTAN